ncbi:MAG: pyruvate, water dikinase regulatory protein [Sporomusaceae bacterium]|nr:pyruvate, water dikinase regulatory protein [Sporomusaceae bacterium]
MYILSDSIGETGELVVRAAASQFNAGNIDVRRIPYLNTARDVEDAMLEVAACQAAVVYTLVRPDLREVLVAKAQELAVVCVDIMGPIISCLAAVTGRQPRLEPGLIHKLDEAYFSKLEAVEFAVKYDDGKQPWGLAKADLVVVGVSRTTKTPLCMFLAHKGIKAANVPLVPEVPVPEDLLGLPAEKVVGLTINPSLLHEIRRERLKTLGLAEGVDYANLERIYQELDYAQRIMHKIGCPIVDVTNKAVEETAAKILEHYRKGACK